MHLQKSEGLHKRQALAELLLGLAGESHDHVGGKAYISAESRPQLVRHGHVLGGVVDPAHPPQGGVTAALQRKMELGAQAVHPGQNFNLAVGHQIRLQAAQPDAVDALHLPAGGGQAGQGAAGILAVTGQVDARQHHFPVARVRQGAQFRQHAFLAAAAHPAPGPGNHAVGALPVAAVLYLDERPGMALEPLHGQFFKGFAPLVGGNLHQPFAAVQHPLHPLQQAAPVGAAGYQIGFLHGGSLLRECLGIAAGQHGHCAGIFPLGPPQPLAAFLVAARGHGAAVHNINVCRFILPGQGVAVLAEQLLQRPGLVLVYLAAQRIKTNAHSVSSQYVFLTGHVRPRITPYYNGIRAPVQPPRTTNLQPCPIYIR